MQLANLKQSGLNATLMGCIQGASDYFELGWSATRLYGYTGHAFLINVHRDLCPSSPYVWNHDPFFLALRNLGIRRVESLSAKRDDDPADRARIEARLRDHLAAGRLCMMDFLEHQLLAGYDARGFIFLRPWGCSDVELPNLSFGSWEEAFSREAWVQFTVFDKGTESGRQMASRTDEAALLSQALTIALRMRDAGRDFAHEGYSVGDEAWEVWIQAVRRGLGSGHGHFWTGSVWAECRSMAADFFAEIGPDQERERARSLCAELSSIYHDCAARLEAAKNKQAPAEAQERELRAGRDLDGRGAERMRELLAAG